MASSKVISRRKYDINGTSNTKEVEDHRACEVIGRRLISTRTFAVALVIVIFVGSLLRENDMVPNSYFADKRNAFNQHFVKWSWGWTLCLLTPYLLLLSWVKSPREIAQAAKAILRVVVLTATWYFWVEFFMYTIHERTGECSVDTYGDSGACRRGGGRWIGFDISGHSFLLVFIILSTHEELASFWELEKFSRSKSSSSIPSTSNTNTNSYIYLCTKCLLKTLVIAISLMQSLCVVMVIATSLYFHTISHKLLGTALGILNWYLTYKVWFNSDSKFSLPFC